MTVTYNYADTTRRAESYINEALDGWRSGLNNWIAPFQAVPAIPQLDVVEAVERQTKVVQQFVDVNAEYFRQLAEAGNTVSGAVRQHFDGLSDVWYNQVQTVSEVAQGTVQTFEESVRDSAEQAEQAQRDQAKQTQREQAAKVQREAREERQQVRDHYRGLNKNELAEEAAKRNLPKTGTVDELVDRLVEDVTSK
jgi:hypothetical protein